MPTPALFDAADLSSFPGAPFAESVVDAVGSSIRADAGWHIAPSISETLTVESYGGPWLFLRTLHLTAVTEVRRVNADDSETPVTGFSTRPTARFKTGCLYRAGGWGCGIFEVDVVHGHEVCPPELLPAAAYRAQRSRVNSAAGAMSLGGLSVSPGGVPNTPYAEAAQPDSVVSRYRIPRA